MQEIQYPDGRLVVPSYLMFVTKRRMQVEQWKNSHNNTNGEQKTKQSTTTGDWLRGIREKYNRTKADTRHKI